MAHVSHWEGQVTFLCEDRKHIDEMTLQPCLILPLMLSSASPYHPCAFYPFWDNLQDRPCLLPILRRVTFRCCFHPRRRWELSRLQTSLSSSWDSWGRSWPQPKRVQARLLARRHNIGFRGHSLGVMRIPDWPKPCPSPCRSRRWLAGTRAARDTESLPRPSSLRSRRASLRTSARRPSQRVAERSCGPEVKSSKGLV